MHPLGWREWALSDGSGLRGVDPAAAPVSTALGVLGMPGFTAWYGLFEIGGRRRARSSSSRASRAPSVARPGRWRAHRGLSGRRERRIARRRSAWAQELGFDGAFDYHEQSPRQALAELAPDGIDIYFDNVGGDQLEAAIGALGTFGRVVACGSISRYNDAEAAPGPRNLFMGRDQSGCASRATSSATTATASRSSHGRRRSGWETADCATGRRSSRGSRTRRRRSSGSSAARTSGRCSSPSGLRDDAPLPDPRAQAAAKAAAVLPDRALPALRPLRQAHSPPESLTHGRRRCLHARPRLWYEPRAWGPTTAPEWGGDCARRGAASASPRSSSRSSSASSR